MSGPVYAPPEFDIDGFNCPHCGAYSHQEWFAGIRGLSGEGQYWADIPNFRGSRCSRCKSWCYWIAEKLASPNNSPAPPPNADLSESIKQDYAEAAAIAHSSPRGAAALLRLAVQKLCKQLGKPGENINSDIGALVAEGLPSTIEQALDVVRVVGNNAVHPGELDITDDIATVSALFRLVNIIADRLITQPREIEALHDSLPPAAHKAIGKRDVRATAAPPTSRKP